ncbi:hypothetical protein [Aeromonas caviae]
MFEYSFKTRAYRLYAPQLFKITKLYAKLRFNFTAEHQVELYSMLWDRFLAKKFLSEHWQVNGTAAYQLPWRKKTNKLYILGSGGSINDITDDEWNTIKQHDSIGVNYFYFHKFKPTAHFVELGKSKAAFDCVHKYLLCNKERTEPVFMQIRHLINNEVTLQSAKNRVHLYSPTTMQSKNIDILRQYLKFSYLPLWKKSPLIQHSSTLDCVINFAVRQGYKEICLVGVDLNNNQYFWDLSSDNMHYHEAINAVNEDYKIANWVRNENTCHATVNKELTNKYNCLDLITYLQLLNEVIFIINGIKLVVSNKNSLLASYFPYQSINDFSNYESTNNE